MKYLRKMVLNYHLKNKAQLLMKIDMKKVLKYKIQFMVMKLKKSLKIYQQDLMNLYLIF